MLLFFTILLIEILSGAEVDLFIPSFPELQRVFHLSPFYVQFMLSANLVAYCFCSFFSGTLGDRYNRRHVMLISLAILILGSVLCVVAPNYPTLLVGRILQGVGMAGPAVLAYAVISDQYPIEKQASMLGILSGVTTLGMAFAPVVGSYVNLYFGWRGNFELILAFSGICLVLGYFTIPQHPGSRQVSLSPKAYWPLLQSPIFLTFVLVMCLLITPYWVFVGIAPILYMQDLGVALKHFGYYQGAIAATFSIVCLASPRILHWLGQKRCFYGGIALCLISVILMLGLILFHVHHSFIITGVMLVMAAAIIFPVNILFPLSLTILENSKGRATAVLLGSRLILTALTLSTVSYFYDGTFFYIGLSMVLYLGLSLLFIRRLLLKKWVQLT